VAASLSTERAAPYHRAICPVDSGKGGFRGGTVRRSPAPIACRRWGGVRPPSEGSQQLRRSATGLFGSISTPRSVHVVVASGGLRRKQEPERRRQNHLRHNSFPVQLMRLSAGRPMLALVSVRGCAVCVEAQEISPPGPENSPRPRPNPAARIPTRTTAVGGAFGVCACSSSSSLRLSNIDEAHLLASPDLAVFRAPGNSPSKPKWWRRLCHTHREL